MSGKLLPKILQFMLILSFLGFLLTRPTAAFQTDPSPYSDPIQFKHITDADGLPHPVIHDILQDQQGFIWVGTGDGLARYDSNSFKLYQHDPDDPHSLSSNTVTSIYEARDGTIWVGTRTGLNVLDKQSDSITRYTHDPADPTSISNDVIGHQSLYEDGDGNMWIGTKRGLNKFDRKTAVFTHYQHDPAQHNSIQAMYPSGDGLWVGATDGLDYFDLTTEQFIHYEHDDLRPNSLIQDEISSLYVTPDEAVLWVGTTDGLDRLDLNEGRPLPPEQTQFTHYQYDEQNPKSLGANEIIDISGDIHGGIWIGLSNGGLNYFDPSTDSFIHFQPIAGDPTSLSSNSVSVILQDKDDGLWVGTEGGWINYYHATAQKFDLYRNNPIDPNSLSHNSVAGIQIDQQGEIWLATWGGGLNRFNPENGTFTHYKHDPDDPNSLSSNDTFNVYEDSRGDLWIMTIGGGINRYNRATDSFTRFQYDANDPHSLSHNTTRWMEEDENGRLWIATLAGGVSVFDPETEQFTAFQHDPNDPQSLCNNQTWSILRDAQGVMWVATVGCIHKYDPATDSFQRYRYDLDDPAALSSDTPIQLFEDSQNRFWITSNNGLNLFDRDTETFTHYTEKDGLPSNRVTSIIEDDAGILWLGTSQGLSRFDPDADTFRNYGISDGLQGDLFLYPSAAKGADGTLYVGGSNGLNLFHPDDLPDNLIPPPAVLTDFQLFNEPVPIGDGSPLPKHISYLDEIILSHDQSDIRFEIAALNYAASEKNQLSYILEGFDPQWTTTSAEHNTIRYTNLDAGIYTLRVKAANNDELWNETETILEIRITPPWWETWYFRVFTLFSLMGLLFVGYRLSVSTIERRNRELEQLVSERTAELLEQQQLVAVETERRRLARNLHDSITQSVHSLGLTAKTARYLLEKEQYTALSDSLTLISDSAKQAYREMRLILYELQVTDDEQTDLIEVLRARLGKVEQHAGITATFQADGVANIAKSDEVELFYIVTEALNNAMKHARADNISVTIQGKQQTITATIADDGQGFSEPFIGLLMAEHLNYTGMGLQNIMDRAVRLGGTVKLETAPDAGTTITVTIPSKGIE